MRRELLGPARIAGDRSQRVFDALLRTIAEPGTVRRLPDGLDPRVPVPAWLPLALADVDVGVHVDDAELEALVTAATGSPAEPLETAPFVVLGSPSLDQLARIRTGTPLAPEDGARLALPATALVDLDLDVDLDLVTEVAPGDHDPRPGVTCTLAGPGVAGRRHVRISGLAADIVAALGRRSGRPAATGFDTWMFTPEGTVMAIPRSTDVTVHPGGDAGTAAPTAGRD